MSTKLQKFRPLINLTAFQITWLFIVLSSTYSIWLLGFIALIVLWVFHLKITAERPGKDILMLFLCLIFGGIFDSALMLLGFTSFPDYNIAPFSLLVPGWMLMLWAGFATILYGVLKIFSRNPAFSILFGLIGGPLAYYFGGRLGALEVNGPALIGYAGVALAWGVAMPLLYYVAEQILPEEDQ